MILHKFLKGIGFKNGLHPRLHPRLQLLETANLTFWAIETERPARLSL